MANQSGENRGQDARKTGLASRGRSVLVVSDLKPVPRGGGGARCWLQIQHDQAVVGAERSRIGIRLALHVSSKLNANTGTRRGENPSVGILYAKK
jgi:hypothetical protein